MGKGKKTRDLILGTALEVFRERRYGNSSVNEIAKRLGVRTSLVYYYFANKEDIFNELAVTYRDGLEEEIRQHISFEGSLLQNVINILVTYKDYIRSHKDLYDTFREVEFVEKDLIRDYYQRITHLIAQVLPTDFSKLYDLETLAFAILGSVYFVVIKNLIWENKEDIDQELETVKVFLDKGIDIDGTFTPFIVPENPMESQEPQFASRGERTKYQLLKAGEKLFGEKGFEKTQLTEITSEAGVGLGTFYLYFESKTELLAEIVKYVNHTLRKTSRIYQDGLTDRRTIENVGFQAFYHLFKNMGPAYRIVREAEFVEPSIGIWYYTRLAEGYTKGLAQAMESKQIRPMDPEVLAYILMGVSHTTGIKWFVLDECKEINDNSVLTVLELVMHGLSGMERKVTNELQRNL
ncbi:TetR/AcrR family transcriptional regulator [Coprothermobacter proteolyticus]|uniref:TetR family transcriptional regulator n=1 Tax=Coprothermobacter proteolyticus (strain ATCC 35245 / DSM 5265 / OCM 4 / BT) TaxID=309798 RepID=B5Y606_COPPD|nr:TetR/AcrR family transcriptional regulator [Coprothermobacter proteolyticus]ACI17695.1 hypothetical protein COPRO5265_1384 [Coprothermobacter proteolyticus DSM 5265]MBP8983771.1 TetR/AcrR family transcriptional regulator [Coprothermobacter sp.]NLT83621.1 TetR/AcrR family transcriptional regulator [Coprothermobacter proteolyticus]